MNWGYKLILVFVVFISGMGYLVYRATNTEFELVETEYYKKELNYQSVIDGTKNAKDLSAPVNIRVKDAQVVLQMPEEMKGQTITGKVWFYCANDASKDKHFDLAINNEGQQEFAPGQLRPGRYQAKLEWVANEQSYYAEIPFEI